MYFRIVQLSWLTDLLKMYFCSFKQDSATFKLLNHQNLISFTSYWEHLNDKFTEMTFIFHFPPKKWISLPHQRCSSSSRHSRSQIFFKKVVRKSFTIFTGKNLYRSLFLIISLLKRNSNASVFLWILQSF